MHTHTLLTPGHPTSAHAKLASPSWHRAAAAQGLTQPVPPRPRAPQLVLPRAPASSQQLDRGVPHAQSDRHACTGSSLQMALPTQAKARSRVLARPTMHESARSHRSLPPRRPLASQAGDDGRSVVPGRAVTWRLVDVALRETPRHRPGSPALAHSLPASVNRSVRTQVHLHRRHSRLHHRHAGSCRAPATSPPRRRPPTLPSTPTCSADTSAEELVPVEVRVAHDGGFAPDGSVDTPRLSLRIRMPHVVTRGGPAETQISSVWPRCEEWPRGARAVRSISTRRCVWTPWIAYIHDG